MILFTFWYMKWWPRRAWNSTGPAQKIIANHLLEKYHIFIFVDIIAIIIWRLQQINSACHIIDSGFLSLHIHFFTNKTKNMFQSVQQHGGSTGFYSWENGKATFIRGGGKKESKRSDKRTSKVLCIKLLDLFVHIMSCNYAKN